MTKRSEECATYFKKNVDISIRRELVSVRSSGNGLEVARMITFSAWAQGAMTPKDSELALENVNVTI